MQIGSGGNVLVNSPYAIAQTLLVMSLFAVFIMTAFVANVVVRDDETGFGPIIHATRITRFDYLFGRFSGAFLAGCLAFLSVPLGMMIGAAMPWLDPETVGPVQRLALRLDLLLRLRADAVRHRRRLLRDRHRHALDDVDLRRRDRLPGALSRGRDVLLRGPEFERAVALVEPFGLGAFGQATKYWTATERNTLLPELAGHILWNRVIWIGVAFALLGLAWRLYSRAARGATTLGRKARRGQATPTEPAPAEAPRPLTAARDQCRGAPRRRRLEPARGRWRNSTWPPPSAAPPSSCCSASASSTRSASLWFADELYGNTIYPVTRVMIETLQGSFTIIPLIIAIYYAGELVWRDRDRRMHEIIDSTPAPDWAFVVPKILAISLVLFATLAVEHAGRDRGAGAERLFQLRARQLPAWYVLPTTVGVVMFAVLAIFMQALVPHKFARLVLMLLFVVAQIDASTASASSTTSTSTRATPARRSRT